MRTTTTSGRHGTRLALVCGALARAACASGRQTRALGAVDVRGWRVEVVGWIQHHHQRGGLLVPASDQWAVGATLRATRAGERAPVDAGSLWSAPYRAEAPARAQFSTRRRWAEEMLSPFLVAAREGLEPELALDFTLRGDGADRRGLLAENELYRVAPQRDAYGDVDVLRAERARLLAAVARGSTALAASLRGCDTTQR